MMPLPVPRVGFSNCGKPGANDSAGSAAVPSATAARWARREWRMRFCMVVPFRSGQEEEAQDDVHRDEADADAEELALVEAALGPPHVGRSDGPDAPNEQDRDHDPDQDRSEEQTYEIQKLMRISYA